MSCNVSSIALTCLHLAPLAEQVDPEEIWGEDECQNRRNKVLVPLWLGEILSNGYHPRIWNTLQTILKKDALVECTNGDSAGAITCIDVKWQEPLM